MKVRTFKSKQILLLYLLKYKTINEQLFKKKKDLRLNILIRSCLIDILLSFKKSLRIIFYYHVQQKVILFIGLPELLSVKINKFTRHAAISKYDNLPGSILNTSKYKNVIFFIKNNLLKKKMLKKPNLIVLFDHVNAYDIVKESYSTKIPLICVNVDYDKKKFYYRNVYTVFLTQNMYQPLYNFFWVGLSFLFK